MEGRWGIFSLCVLYNVFHTSRFLYVWASENIGFFKYREPDVFYASGI